MPRRKSTKATNKPKKIATRASSRVARSSAKTEASQPTVTTRSAVSTVRTVFYVIALILLLGGGYILFVHRPATNNQTNAQTQEISYKGQDGQNALQLLKDKHQVSSQKYDFGEFVTGIDNQTAPQGYYWAFYVNGQQSDKGADQYITKNSDTLSWKLVKIQ